MQSQQETKKNEAGLKPDAVFELYIYVNKISKDQYENLCTLTSTTECWYRNDENVCNQITSFVLKPL